MCLKIQTKTYIRTKLKEVIRKGKSAVAQKTDRRVGNGGMADSTADNVNQTDSNIVIKCVDTHIEMNMKCPG